MKKYLVLLTATVLVGCASLYSSIVTVTDVRKSVMNEYGELYRSGNLTESLITKVRAADAQYLVAAESMKLALIAYKAGTSTNDPIIKLEEVKAPVMSIVSIITPLIGEVIANKHNKDLAKATKL